MATTFVAMNKRIICGLLIFSFTLSGLSAMPQSQEPDKKVQRKERREERRQEREDRREKRKAERQQKKDSQEPVETEEIRDTNPILEMPQEEGASLSRGSVDNTIPKRATQTVGTRDDRGSRSSATTTKPSAPSSVSSETSKTSDRSSTLSTSSDANTENSDSGWGIVILLLFIGSIVYSIISWIRSRRCPHCGKLRAMQEIDEKFLGVAKTERVKQDNQIYYVHHNRVQITRRCKYCGYMDYQNKVIKGDEA